ncbi:MAG: NUDIX domain-containing protein [Devosiaceae bacterium]|nr:NUDIX domain-containing protein [Devosiaceae bacterium MH13]
MSDQSRFRPVSETLLAESWGHLTRYTFDYQHADGRWERQVREAYDRGDGAACLLHDPDADTVLLTRQFRLPAQVRGDRPFLIEVPAGKLDGADAVSRMRAELLEETGYAATALHLVSTPFSSPGSVTERLALFVGTYSRTEKVAEGGGHKDEGEDIEVLHVPFDEALAMIANGEIIDAKTILLLQHLALERLRAHT